MHACAIVLWALLSAVPPLTGEQSALLETAYDGADHREPAFEALLENVRQWTPGTAADPVRLLPDVDAMAADPAAFRGDLCRVEGVLSQQTWLAAPHESVCEWFIRDAGGRPILVYVSGLDRAHGFRIGMPVAVDARFYKRVEAEALDGRFHRYPAFVGAFPQAAPGAAAAWGGLWAVVVPVAILLAVFLILLVYARAGAPRPRPAAIAPWTPDDVEDLPQDPAEALAELRRRAEADS